MTLLVEKLIARLIKETTAGTLKWKKDAWNTNFSVVSESSIGDAGHRIYLKAYAEGYILTIVAKEKTTLDQRFFENGKGIETRMYESVKELAFLINEQVSGGAKIYKDVMQSLNELSYTQRKGEDKISKRKREQMEQWQAERAKPTIDRKLEYLGLPVRITNGLVYGGFETLRDVIAAAGDGTKLLRMRNFGRTSLATIEEFLNEHGLRFGMDV